MKTDYSDNRGSTQVYGIKSRDLIPILTNTFSG